MAGRTVAARAAFIGSGGALGLAMTRGEKESDRRAVIVGGSVIGVGVAMRGAGVAMRRHFLKHPPAPEAAFDAAVAVGLYNGLGRWNMHLGAGAAGAGMLYGPASRLLRE